jgi:O-antigen ligase
MVADAHAHNDYLELLAETGVAGCVLFVALAVPAIAALMRASMRTGFDQERALAAACLGSLAAIAVHSLFDFNLHIPANAMALCWVLGVGGAVSRTDAEECGARQAANR